jgi:hypothetical protein
MHDASVRAFLEPQWFFPLFAATWFAITGLLAHLGGWARLARRYRATRPPAGERFRFASGSMGWRFLPVSYGGCLFVTVGDEGIHLSILFLFRFLRPPLFIPWSAMESVSEKRFIVSTYTAIRVRGEWPTIALRGRAGHYVREAYAHLHLSASKASGSTG